MSNQFYDRQWKNALDKLESVVLREYIEKQEQLRAEVSGKPIQNNSNNDEEETTTAIASSIELTKEAADAHHTQLFHAYRQIHSELEECHDQMTHPQKRRDMKVLLNSVSKRISELRLVLPLELLKLYDDSHNDENLVRVPNYISEDPNKLEHLSILDDLFDKYSEFIKFPSIKHAPGRYLRSQPVEMTLKEAIQTIIRAERFRQGIVKVKIQKQLLMINKQVSSNSEQKKTERRNEAATDIQRVFRGYRDRKRIRFLRECDMETLEMLDMKHPSEFDPLELRKQLEEERRTLRMEHEIEYQTSIQDIREDLLTEEGPMIREKARQERFDWAIKCKNTKGKYPTSFKDFYKLQKLISEGMTEEEAESALGAKSESSKKKKGGKKGSDKKKGDKKKKDGKKDKKESKDGKKKSKKESSAEADDGNAMMVRIITPNTVKNEMYNALQKNLEWKNIDETFTNPLQRHNIKVVMDEIRPSVVKQVQAQVDIQLIQTLTNLEQQTGGGDGSSSSKKKSSKKGKKKGGKKKGKKAKK